MIAIIIFVNGLYLMPITVPVLSPERFLGYTKTLPFKLPVNEHSHARAALAAVVLRPVRMERNRRRNRRWPGTAFRPPSAPTAASSCRTTDKPAPSISSAAARVCPAP